VRTIALQKKWGGGDKVIQHLNQHIKLLALALAAERMLALATDITPKIVLAANIAPAVLSWMLSMESVIEFLFICMGMTLCNQAQKFRELCPRKDGQHSPEAAENELMLLLHSTSQTLTGDSYTNCISTHF
jgi:hypothetical protein